MLEILSEVGLWDGFDLDEVQWFSAGPVVLPSSNRGHLEVWYLYVHMFICGCVCAACALSWPNLRIRAEESSWQSVLGVSDADCTGFKPIAS